MQTEFFMKLLVKLLCSAGLSIVSIILLLLLTKWLGNRQMSQFTLFDYINGITIGSIAAELAIASGDMEELLPPVVGMVVYTAAAFLINLCTEKSLKLRRFFTGRTILLMKDGKLYRKNFRIAHLDVSEFLELCREQGYFDIAELSLALLEPGGKLSLLPYAAKRPMTAEDAGLAPPEKTPPVSVILDGKIVYGNLRRTGKDENWLLARLREQGYGGAEKVFLAMLADGELAVYREGNTPLDGDPYK